MVTLEGIDEAILNLQYHNKNLLKYRLLSLIRSAYDDDKSVKFKKGIDPNELIKRLWNVDDITIMKSKRKNLSTIRASINSDFTRLYNEGLNPEGVIIGSYYVFDMTEEAKNKILEAFSDTAGNENSVPLGSVMNVLNIINDFLSKSEKDGEDEKVNDFQKFEQLKEIIKSISQKVGLGTEGADSEISAKIDEYGGALGREDELGDLPEEEAAEELEDDEELEEVDVVDGPEDEEEINKARALAEKFDNLLSVMDIFYNQYLLITKGKYIVGTGRNVNGNRTEQEVSLDAFYFGEFPVTNSLFEVFVENTGYKTTAEIFGYGVVYKGRYQNIINDETGMETFNWNSSLESNIVEGAFWYQPLGPGSTLYNKRSHPVVQVSFKDAMAFASWTGKRLPSEDEWEAASRTKKGYRYPWGNRFRKNACNIEDSQVGGTTPVDQYKKYSNSFGIVDTFGNVLEWTLDIAVNSQYSDPEHDFYIVKGRSWASDKSLGLSSRLEMEAGSTSNILGFRCVAY